MIIYARKNVAFILAIPMVDSSNPALFKTGLTVSDTAYYRDGAGAWTALSITDTCAEIGSTGLYSIVLTPAEMNHDYIIIKAAASGAADTFVTFKTGLQDITTAQITAAIKAMTGLTAGDTSTFAGLMKAFSAYMLGTWRDKSGQGGAIQEILDADDDATVVMELTASETTPYKTISLL